MWMEYLRQNRDDLPLSTTSLPEPLESGLLGPEVGIISHGNFWESYAETPKNQLIHMFLSLRHLMYQEKIWRAIFRWFR